LVPSTRIKRESGENPEQSRCCKFHRIVQVSHCHCFPTGRRLTGNKSEDLPRPEVSKAFEEKAGNAGISNILTSRF